MATKKKKKSSKKKSPKKKSSKKSKRPATKNKQARLTLTVKSAGRTADGSAGLYQGSISSAGRGTVGLGTLAASDQSAARTKFARLAKSLLS